MQFEESIEIQTTTQTIFALYADVSSWASWDPDVRSSSIEGAFVPGALGHLKPSSGPESRITFTEVIADKSFTVESKLPLCVMRFEHELSATSTGTVAVHRVTFSGPLSLIFSRLIGGSIRRGLPHTMAGLKQAAEQANKSIQPTAKASAD